MQLGVFLTALKMPGRGANQLLSASAEVKKVWIYTYTFPYAIMA
jgi:hypothetical protein